MAKQKAGRKIGYQSIPKVQAHGMRCGGQIRVYVGLHPEQFAIVRDLAVEHGVGVAEKIRELIYDGLEANDENEPARY